MGSWTHNLLLQLQLGFALFQREVALNHFQSAVMAVSPMTIMALSPHLRLVWFNSLRREVEGWQAGSKKREFEKWKFYNLVGEVRRDYKNISQINVYKAKKTQQTNHNLSVKPYLVSFTEQKSFLSPNLLCKQTSILLKLQINLGCRFIRKFPGMQYKGRTVILLSFPSFWTFVLLPLKFILLLWDTMSTYLSNINWKPWSSQFLKIFMFRLSKEIW